MVRPFAGGEAACSTTTITTPNDDMVNGMPETAAFDAVLGRSLTVAGLVVTCIKGHGQPGLQ